MRVRGKDCSRLGLALACLTSFFGLTWSFVICSCYKTAIGLLCRVDSLRGAYAAGPGVIIDFSVLIFSPILNLGALFFVKCYVCYEDGTFVSVVVEGPRHTIIARLERLPLGGADPYVS
jgi:hypothetical protein